jgi:hypothetical protein
MSPISPIAASPLAARLAFSVLRSRRGYSAKAKRFNGSVGPNGALLLLT